MPCPVTTDPRGSSTFVGASARLLARSAFAWCAPRSSDDRAVFERSEADGRSHAPWVLEATVAPTEEGSHLVMHLHYGGALWGPVLERMLGDEIEKSRPRLLACLSR